MLPSGRIFSNFIFYSDVEGVKCTKRTRKSCKGMKAYLCFFLLLIIKYKSDKLKKLNKKELDLAVFEDS